MTAAPTLPRNRRPTRACSGLRAVHCYTGLTLCARHAAAEAQIRWADGMSETEIKERIRRFWREFERLAPRLNAAASANDTTYDTLLADVQQVHPELYLEFSVGQPSELIVTAEGNREVFSLAREVVAAAPPVSGWSIRALRPKMGFPRSVRWNEVEIRLSDVRFQPLFVEGSDDLGLRIFVPEIREDQVEDAHNAILRALDHALGEEQFATAVRFTEIVIDTASSDSEERIPFAELEAFITSRECQPT